MTCPSRSATAEEKGEPARALVRPRDAEEVAIVLRLASTHRVRVVPQGARTGLVGGTIADDSGDMVLLGLDRLNHHLVVDPVNRSVTADAGVLLSDVNAAAAEHGLVFPIDLGADPTVGGMISANTGGARFLRYGDVRRNVLGLEVVLADGEGTRLDLGGALWKDNSGIDLKQMLVGASGSLGVVTRATLALQPRPAVSVSAMLALRHTESVTAVLCALEAHCGTLLTAFEGISPAAYEAALAHVPRLRRPFAGNEVGYYVLIELSAGAAHSSGQLEEMLASALEPWMAAEGAILDVAIDHRSGLWDIRHAVPEGLRALGAVIGCDIALRRGDVFRFRDTVGREVEEMYPGLRLYDFGHVGDGGLHFNLVWPHALGPVDAGIAERAREHVFAAAVERFEGSFSAEHGIGPRNISYYRRWTSPAERRVAGSVQTAFSPVALGRVDFGLSWQDRKHGH